MSPDPAGPAGSVDTAEDLHASASKATGLTDFGPDDYRDGLAVLLESCDGEAGLTSLGRKAMRAMLRGALAARLVSEAGWRTHPEHAQVRIERPLFVTGLPRTGTTALHRLLTADPAHQGLELWLAEVPQPRPPRDRWETNPVYRHIQAACERHHTEHPEFMGVHYVAADQARSAGSCCGSPCGRCPGSAWRTCRRTRPGCGRRTGPRRTGGTGATCSSSA